MTVPHVIPAGLAPERRRICEVALGELGTRERPWASNRGPVERYMPRWMTRRLKQDPDRRGPPWCAYWLTWCWEQALEDGSPVGHIGSVHRCATRAEEMDRWVPVEQAGMALGAAPGDAFVMLDRPLGHGSKGHTGIVLQVSSDGMEIATVEGNTGHSVRIGRRRLDEPRMRGTISVLGDLGGGAWVRGVQVEGEDVSGMGTR